MQAGRKEKECIALKDKNATAFSVKMKKNLILVFWYLQKRGIMVYITFIMI